MAGLVLWAGCRETSDLPEGETAERPLAGIKLRLAVVDDPALAEAARRLRGEWAAQSGAEMAVEEVAAADLASERPPAADVVIGPSDLLGPLAERNLLAPLPEKLLQDNAGQWATIFNLPRLRSAAWGDRAMAVPLGSPVLTCYYRPDLLEVLKRRPPQTWAEYQELAELLAERERLGSAAPAEGAAWAGTIEPLGSGWAGLVLLARAAPYAKHRSNFSTLFDVRSMEPLVAGPPFERALSELVAAAKTGPPEQLDYSPADVRAAFWRGECGMALSWPTAAKAGLPEGLDAAKFPVGFVELPGSREVFDVGGRKWDVRTDDNDPHVPLLGVSGRLGVLSAASKQHEAGFHLLMWLAGEQVGAQFCTASPETTLFCRSDLKNPGAWVEPPIQAEAAARYAELTAKTLGREQYLFALRIPGRAEYLAALDEAVRKAARGEQPPLEALIEAAGTWREITERLGAEKQRAAYRHSLGL